MLILDSFIALAVAHFLPGLLIVKLLNIGRDREERFVFCCVFGGPISALIYFVSVQLDWQLLYWIVLGSIVLGAVLVPFRSTTNFAWPKATKLMVIGTLVLVLSAYSFTTGSFYGPDDSGNYWLDQTLQRDTLFHVGIIRSLEYGYPPSLLSVSGEPVGYHVGHHLQLAAWARYFGIDAVDGLVKTGALWQLTLFILSAIILSRRFTKDLFAQTIAPVLIFGTGLGFLAFSIPSVDWWSLVFLDVAVVSLFLANPFLPALPLLFTGLVLLDDYMTEKRRGALIGSVFCFAFVLIVKMFLGAQLIAALGLAWVVCWYDRDLRNVFVWTVLASLPLIMHTFFAAVDSNTTVGFRPLEIVRYSMEKLSWHDAVEVLTDIGRWNLTGNNFLFLFACTLFWLIGFLGLRVLGTWRWAEDLTRESRPLRRVMAWFVFIGFPVALLFRIGPGGPETLSRFEGQNDVVWFAAASGMFLWFWTAEALTRHVVLASMLFLAFPSTVQHFVHAANLKPDIISAESMSAAHKAKTVSSEDSVWLDPLDRSRPSLLPYIAGRAVVYDPYVGYDYMFVGKEEIDYRRHAIAQFWSSSDLGYRLWLLEYFKVNFIWSVGNQLPLSFGIDQVYQGENIHLYRYNSDIAASRTPFPSILTPKLIPLGGGGSPYLSAEWRRKGLIRELQLGRSKAYIPRSAGKSLQITLRFQPTDDGGVLVVNGHRVSIAGGTMIAQLSLPPQPVAGLETVDFLWQGQDPLSIFEFRLDL